jgi:hypothetical protein
VIIFVLHWLTKGFKCKKCYSSKVIIRKDLGLYCCLRCDNIDDYAPFSGKDERENKENKINLNK